MKLIIAVVLVTLFNSVRANVVFNQKFSDITNQHKWYLESDLSDIQNIMNHVFKPTTCKVSFSDLSYDDSVRPDHTADILDMIFGTDDYYLYEITVQITCLENEMKNIELGYHVSGIDFYKVGAYLKFTYQKDNQTQDFFYYMSTIQDSGIVNNVNLELDDYRLRNLGKPQVSR